MPLNFTSLSFHRENGSVQKNVARRKSAFHIFNHKDLAFSFYENNVKNIYCLNSMKYHIPASSEFEAPPYAAEFCRASGSESIFAVADEDGNVSLFSSLHSSSKSTPLKPLHKVHAHNNAIFDIAWVPQENVLITASGDNTASIWDMIKGVSVSTFRGHSCSLRAVNVSKHNTNLLVTGSRDGNVMVWDKRSTQPIIRIQDAHVTTDHLTPKRKRRRAGIDQTQSDSQQTVSCAIFQDSQTVITAGTRDGILKIWDLRKFKKTKKNSAKNSVQPVETLPYPGSSLRRRGYTCLTLDSSNSQLYASCTDDSVYHYNLATSCLNEKRSPICSYNGHVNSSFYVRTTLSADDRFLLGGSCDNKAYIWTADGKCQLPTVHLASEAMSEVTAVAWCPTDVTRLVTCSDDCVVRLWSMPYGEYEKRLDIDGRAGTVRRGILPTGCKCGCGFNTISVIKRHPTPSPSSSKMLTFNDENLATPVKGVPDTMSPSQTPSRKLVQTSVTSLFTPTRTLKSTTSSKVITPVRCASNVLTPPSIEKWLARPGQTKKVKAANRKAMKSLDNQINACEVDDKENTAPLETIDANITPNKSCLPGSSRRNFENDGKENGSLELSDSYVTPNKNWLHELSQKRKSSSGGSASKRQRRILSSPVSSNNGNRTQRRAKSISSYFKDASV